MPTPPDHKATEDLAIINASPTYIVDIPPSSGIETPPGLFRSSQITVFAEKDIVAVTLPPGLAVQVPKQVISGYHVFGDMLEPLQEKVKTVIPRRPVGDPIGNCK